MSLDMENAFPKECMAEIIGVVKARDNTPCLELRVNIGDQDQRVLLAVDAIANHGMSGPAAVAELQGIRMALEKISERLEMDAYREVDAYRYSRENG